MERRYLCDRDTPIEKIATVVRRFPVVDSSPWLKPEDSLITQRALRLL
jgi:hypothetical protein